jgi:hypothetical protein
LIDKEWSAFGHKFSERCGHFSKPKSLVPASSESPFSSTTKTVSNFFSSAAKYLSNASDESADASGSNQSISESQPSKNSAKIVPVNKTKSPREVSPVFTQFLDCIYQLTCAFPGAFEFSSRYLVFMHSNLYSCKYSNFVMNCDLERRQFASSLPSIWDEPVDEYRNPRFLANAGILLPESLELSYWIELYMPDYYHVWNENGGRKPEIQLADLDELLMDGRRKENAPVIADVVLQAEPEESKEEPTDPLGASSVKW